MENVLLGAVVVIIVALVAVGGGLGEVGLAAIYARVWGRRSEHRPRR